jgi:hypothetical protein
VLQQELTDMGKGEAPVQKVAKVTQERHQIIDQIRELNAQFNPEQEPDKQMLDQFVILLQKLRSVSIRAVEVIVLWRDQLRYLALLSTNHRPLRRKRAQQSI